jgi:hypothetical protein
LRWIQQEESIAAVFPAKSARFASLPYCFKKEKFLPWNQQKEIIKYLNILPNKYIFPIFQIIQEVNWICNYIFIALVIIFYCIFQWRRENELISSLTVFGFHLWDTVNYLKHGKISVLEKKVAHRRGPGVAAKGRLTFTVLTCILLQINDSNFSIYNIYLQCDVILSVIMLLISNNDSNNL